jgi:hypothetical protein
MFAGWFGKGMGGAALAALLLAAAPATAVSKTGQKRGASGKFSAASIGSFTPAAADPRAAALIARSGLASGFRFTPAATPGGRRAVTVAVRAVRSNTHASPAATPRTALAAAEQATPLTPISYSLGAAFGWKRFALSGDLTRVETGPLPGGRQIADVGVSYVAPRWSTRLQLGTDRSDRSQPSLLGRDESYSVDVVGSYSLTRNLDVTGGVRYKSQRDWVREFDDQRRDSQSVYVGTAFRF